MEPRKTDVARIADLPPLPETSYNEYNADDESNDSSDLGGAEGIPQVSLKDVAGQLKRNQQVEDMMGGWVPREEASDHNPVAHTVETA
jgi:hypothetical protein